jgi:hypothetical protein
LIGAVTSWVRCRRLQVAADGWSSEIPGTRTAQSKNGLGIHPIVRPVMSHKSAFGFNTPFNIVANNQ